MRHREETTSLPVCRISWLRKFFYLIFLVLASCSGSHGERVDWASLGGYVEPEYPLDGESRKVSARGKLVCPHVQMVEYGGDVVRYHRPVKTNPFFLERLQRFEEVVAAVGMEVYGRAPEAIRHFGVYNCRRVRGKAKLSEHAFANAIDVGGFEFGAQKTGPLHHAFKVSVLDHWDARTGEERLHAKFLYRIAEELSRRPDIFRGILGPGAPGHDDHYHFDVGPYRYIDIGR